jgi:hypothetical protein
MLNNVRVIISNHIHYIHTDSCEKIAKTKTYIYTLLLFWVSVIYIYIYIYCRKIAPCEVVGNSIKNIPKVQLRLTEPKSIVVIDATGCNPQQ